MWGAEDPRVRPFEARGERGRGERGARPKCQARGGARPGAEQQPRTTTLSRARHLSLERAAGRLRQRLAAEEEVGSNPSNLGLPRQLDARVHVGHRDQVRVGRHQVEVRREPGEAVWWSDAQRPEGSEPTLPVSQRASKNTEWWPHAMAMDVCKRGQNEWKTGAAGRGETAPRAAAAGKGAGGLPSAIFDRAGDGRGWDQLGPLDAEEVGERYLAVRKRPRDEPPDHVFGCARVKRDSQR